MQKDRFQVYSYFVSSSSYLDASIAFDTNLFWGTIDGLCPSAMNRDSCFKAFTYSVTNCIADQNTCFHTQKGNGYACPYNICRGPIENFSVEYAKYALLVCVFFLLVHAVAIGLSAKILHETYDSDLEWKSVLIRPRRSATGKSSKDGESPRVVYLKNLGSGEISPAHFNRSPFGIESYRGNLNHPTDEPQVDTCPSPFSSPNSLKYFFSPKESDDDIEAEFWKIPKESIPILDDSSQTREQIELAQDDTIYKDV